MKYPWHLEPGDNTQVLLEVLSSNMRYWTQRSAPNFSHNYEFNELLAQLLIIKSAESKYAGLTVFQIKPGFYYK